LSGKVETDFAASTGVHTGEDAIKCLLAGAKAVEIVSVLYQKKLGEIDKFLTSISEWLQKNNYDSIEQIIGKMSQSKIEEPTVYERAQFIKYFHKRGN